MRKIMTIALAAIALVSAAANAAIAQPRPCFIAQFSNAEERMWPPGHRREESNNPRSRPLSPVVAQRSLTTVRWTVLSVCVALCRG